MVFTVNLNPNAQLNVVDGLPSTIDLRLYQGDDFTMQLVVFDAAGNPVDLAGETVLAQVRSSPTDPNVLATFSHVIEGNVVTLTLTHSNSDFSGSAVWDLQSTTSAGTVTTLARGTMYLTPDVSRSGIIGPNPPSGIYGQGGYGAGLYG